MESHVEVTGDRERDGGMVLPFMRGVGGSSASYVVLACDDGLACAAAAETAAARETLRSSSSSDLASESCVLV